MKIPSLITLQLGLLEQRTDSLQQLLGCSRDAVQRSLLREPSLLASQSDSLQSRYEQLQKLLVGDTDRLTIAVLHDLRMLQR